MPDDIAIGFSGGHNSINTNLQLFPLQRVGVVVLMNTRLEQGIPGPSSNDIAYNLARMAAGAHYEVPSNRVFYGGYAVLDALLLALIISIFWQGLHWKRWPTQYREAKTAKRVVIWLAIVLDLILSVGILALPSLVNSRWNILLFFRPDFSLPLLLIGLGLGIVGLMKIVRIRINN